KKVHPTLESRSCPVSAKLYEMMSRYSTVAKYYSAQATASAENYQSSFIKIYPASSCVTFSLCYQLSTTPHDRKIFVPCGYCLRLCLYPSRAAKRSGSLMPQQPHIVQVLPPEPMERFFDSPCLNP